MLLEGKVKKLKIIVQESEQVYQRSLYEAIVFAAKKNTLAGATVSRGIMGYGSNGLTNSSKTYQLSTDHPIIIEIVDRAERIEDFSVIVSGLIEKAKGAGIVYMEDVDVVIYRKHTELKPTAK